MKVFIASDHAGFYLKQEVINILVMKGVDLVDLGPEDVDSVDYPDYANKLCQVLLNEEEEGAKGILICGTGVGMSITANRHRGIRAALCTELTTAHFARSHNDANVLCLGARIIGSEVAKEIVEVFLHTEFEYGRHKCRLEKIDPPLDVD